MKAPVPLGRIGWNPVLLDDEEVLLKDLTRERLLEEADRREAETNLPGVEACVRIGVERSKDTPPHRGPIEILPGLVGGFNDRQLVDGSFPTRWIHWIYLPVEDVRRALEGEARHE